MGGAESTGWLAVLAATVAGAVAGTVMSRQLAGAAYVREDDPRRRQPPLWWIVPAVAGGWAASAARFAREGWWFLPVPLLVCALGAIVAQTDMHVLRIPVPLGRGLTAGVLALVTLAAAVGHDWARWRRAVLLAGLVWAGALALAVLTALLGGGLGLADVMLLFPLSLMCGWLGPVCIWWALVVSLGLAALAAGLLLVVRRADRRSPLPLGPFLVAGALAAVLVVPVGP